ncbi:MAG TPA: hypothetical protein VHM92_12865 [Allosphingosinicella sp.]|nr:hypothetical protein [Allosphingosinicella sp.]
MKKIIIALAATTAFAGAAPALAQYGSGNYPSRTYQLQEQLQEGVRSGAITRAEAMPLRQQLRQLGQLERQYSYGGITGRERSDLQMRINRLRQQIRFAARNGDSRYDRDDRYGDRYGDRDGDRDDRYDDRYGDRDDRYGDRDDRYGDRYERYGDRYDRDDRYGDRDGRYGRGAVSPTDRDGDGYDDRDRNRDNWIDERERLSAGPGTGTGIPSETDRNGDGYDDRDLNRDRRIDERELRAAQDRYRRRY